jgi:hypothetical protein
VLRVVPIARWICHLGREISAHPAPIEGYWSDDR